MIPLFGPWLSENVRRYVLDSVAVVRVPARARADAPHVSVHRRITVLAPAMAGRYPLVARLWSPESGLRLHRWWRGILLTLDTTVALGRVEVVRRP